MWFSTDTCAHQWWEIAGEVDTYCCSWCGMLGRLANEIVPMMCRWPIGPYPLECPEIAIAVSGEVPRTISATHIRIPLCPLHRQAGAFRRGD
jgi:hypothetical protein